MMLIGMASDSTEAAVNGRCGHGRCGFLIVAERYSNRKFNGDVIIGGLERTKVRHAEYVGR